MKLQRYNSKGIADPYGRFCLSEDVYKIELLLNATRKDRDNQTKMLISDKIKTERLLSDISELTESAEKLVQDLRIMYNGK